MNLRNIYLHDRFKDIFVLAIMNRLRNKYQQNECIWNMVYIVFPYIIIWFNTFEDSLKKFY